MTRGVKRVLITGAAGFIGHHLAKNLAARKDEQVELVLVDNLQRGQMDADLLATIELPNVRFQVADLTNPAEWDGIQRNIDEIYHLAAVNGTKRFYSAPHEVLRTNTLTMIHALDWAAKLERRPKFLFTSSNEAYAGALAAFGQLPIPTPEEVPLVIHDPRNPRWSYAGTKLIGEQFVIHYAAHYQIPSVIVRPHNFYGPRAGYDHVIPELIARIGKRQDPFVLFGPNETRSFCYIDDAVWAMISAMGCASVDPPTFHIGSAEETTIRWLADRLFARANWWPEDIDPQPSPAGSVKRRLADTTCIHEQTGWAATTTLAEGLSRTYEWYVDHPEPAAP